MTAKVYKIFVAQIPKSHIVHVVFWPCYYKKQILNFNFIVNITRSGREGIPQVAVNNGGVGKTSNFLALNINISKRYGQSYC